MPRPVTVTLPHQLGRAEARRRVEAGFADLSKHLGGPAGAVEKHWDGDRLSFAVHTFGQAVSGYVAVADADVTVEVLLPGVLGMIAGTVTGKLRREGQLLLSKK